MKKLLILSASLLCVAGLVSITWAHGPKGGGFGYRGHSYGKPQFHAPSRLSAGIGRHHRHFSRKPFSRRGVSPGSRRLPHIDNGVIHSRPGPLQNRPFNSPIANAYNRGIGVSPIRKAQERKAPPQVPSYTHRPYTHHDDNPEPWFLYGNGKEFRQMGLIPPLP